MKIQRRDQLSFRPMRSSRTGEEFSLSAVLSDDLGSRDFFLHVERIAPGKRTSSPHFHRRTDEIIWVLRGEVIVVEGLEESRATAGDAICFGANSGEGVLVISRRLEEPDVVMT